MTGERIQNPCSGLIYKRGAESDINKDLTVIVSAYKGYHEIEVIINSFLCQRVQNWKMIIGHDGYDEKFESIVEKYKSPTIRYFSSKERQNKWGYNIRNIGLDMVDTTWVLNTNEDNYYVPVFTEIIQNNIKDNDCITYDCIHSHPHPNSLNKSSYGLFKPFLMPGGIDLGQAVIKMDLFKGIRFNENNPAADGELIGEINSKHKYESTYINKCLFVHN